MTGLFPPRRIVGVAPLCTSIRHRLRLSGPVSLDPGTLSRTLSPASTSSARMVDLVLSVCRDRREGLPGLRYLEEMIISDVRKVCRNGFCFYCSSRITMSPSGFATEREMP